MRFRRVSAGGLELLIGVDESNGWTSKVSSGVRRLRRPAKEPAGVPRAESQVRSEPELDGLRTEMASVPQWYHTIDLGSGLTTPGCFDHRPYLSKYPLPERMDGMRVLDCATFDGFWAFEFERRGAQVTALDVPSYRELDLAPAVRARMSDEELDRQTGSGFKIAHCLLNSKVDRRLLNLYELSPARIGGTFDMVFSSDVLLHLMNPMKALQSIRSVTQGYAVIVEWYHPAFPDKFVQYHGGKPDCTWWTFSFGALKGMIEDAGFSDVKAVKRFEVATADGTGILSHAAFIARP